MELLMEIIPYFLIGIFSGFMSGMFGIGGGSIRIPLLNVAGLPLLSAFGINLLVIPFSSCIGTISHKKNVAWKIALYVVVGGTFGSITGAFLVGLVSTLTLAVIFVITAGITVLGLYFDRISPKFFSKINPNSKNIIVGTFFLNLITSMKGGSGGSLFPPFLKMMNLNVRKAIATSLFATFFTAIGGMIVYWHRGDILLVPGLVVIIGSMIGARTGSLISLKTKPMWLEIGLSILIIILALMTVCKAL
jgi:uncharacterized membrane protein YfcA